METFNIFPRQGGLLLLTRERSFCLASTGGPQGSQPLPTGNSHYGGKGMGVESIRYGLDHSSCACQLWDFGYFTSLSLHFLIWKQDGNALQGCCEDRR